jgi:hypothetical protein
MMWHAVVAGASSLLLVSCAALPLPPEADGIYVDQIVDAVQCELASVYRENPKYADSLVEWLATTELRLKVVNTQEFDPRPSITAIPAVSTGTLKVPFGPILSDQSTREVTLKFDVHMRDLKPENLSNRTKQKGRRMPTCSPGNYTGLPAAERTIGLGGWISSMATAVGRNDYATMSSAFYDIEFTVVRGVHGGFSFVSPTVEIAADGGSIRKFNNNELKVAFASDAPQIVAARGGVNAKEKNNFELERRTPQRFELRPGSGLLIR